MEDSTPRIIIDKSDLIKAAVLSKITVVRDFETNNLLTYNETEFLEILARVVDIRSKGTTIENAAMHTKIEGILDQFIKIGDKKAVVK